jgi:hypothetical protein
VLRRVTSAIPTTRHGPSPGSVQPHDYSSNHSSTLEIKSTSSAGKSMATPARTNIKPIARTSRIVSLRIAGRSPDWLKMKNPEAPAVKREAEEDWGSRR